MAFKYLKYQQGGVTRTFSGELDLRKETNPAFSRGSGLARDIKKENQYKDLKKKVEIQKQLEAEDEAAQRRSPFSPIKPKSILYKSKAAEVNRTRPEVTQDNRTDEERKVDEWRGTTYLKHSPTSSQSSQFTIANIGAMPFRYLANPEKMMGDVVNTAWKRNGFDLADSTADREELAVALSNPYRSTYKKVKDYGINRAKELPSAIVNLAIASAMSPSASNAKIFAEVVNPSPIDGYHLGVARDAIKRGLRGRLNTISAAHDATRVGKHVGGRYLQDKAGDFSAKYANSYLGEPLAQAIKTGINKAENILVTKAKQFGGTKLIPKTREAIDNGIENVRRYFYKDKFNTEYTNQDLGKFFSDEINDMLNTPEGRQRMRGMGLDPDRFIKPDLYTTNGPISSQSATHFSADENSILLNRDEIKSNKMLGNEKTATAHELGHWLQSFLFRHNDLAGLNALAKAVDANFAGLIKRGVDEETAFNLINESALAKELYKKRAEAGLTTIDKDLRELYAGAKASEGNEKVFNYFTRYVENRPAVEALPFAREFRQNMIEAGILKHKYDHITPEMIKKFIKRSSNYVPGKVDRMSTFTDPSRIKGLSEILNRIPAVTPVVGGAAALYKSNNTQEQN